MGGGLGFPDLAAVPTGRNLQVSVADSDGYGGEDEQDHGVGAQDHDAGFELAGGGVLDNESEHHNREGAQHAGQGGEAERGPGGFFGGRCVGEDGDEVEDVDAARSEEDTSELQSRLHL